MRRIIILLLIFIISVSAAFAKAEKSLMPVLKFNGTKFSLYYSAKNPQLKTYMNEYYKPSEGYTSWTELIAVHHYPNAYSPIDQAKILRDYLGEALCPSALEVDEENNTAILDFILIDNKKLPIILEFNIFKYEKSPICGTVALQYAKRYRINSSLEVEGVKKAFSKSREKYIKQVKKIPIPDLVTLEIDEGKYVNNEGIKSAQEEDFR